MTLLKALSLAGFIISGGMLVLSLLSNTKSNTLHTMILLFFLLGSTLVYEVINNITKNKKIKSLIPTFVFVFIFAFACGVYFTSPEAVLITTGRYGQGTPEQNRTVDYILGAENAEERFALYFQWYNILHEIGHGIIYHNSDSRPHPVDEEQLVNDFAVAFWSFYGEEDKFRDLEYMVAYALENFERPVDENVTHMEYARNNWGKRDLFTFNNYGWFQFNCVNSSLQEIRPLESVLSEMGVKNINIQPQGTLVYPVIGENTAAEIIYDAVSLLRRWGAVIPDVYHTWDNDPNRHMIQFKKNVLGYLDRLHILASPVK